MNKLSPEHITRIQKHGVWLVGGHGFFSAESKDKWSVLNAKLAPIHTFTLANEAQAEGFAAMLGLSGAIRAEEFYKMRRVQIMTEGAHDNLYDPLLKSYEVGPNNEELAR